MIRLIAALVVASAGCSGNTATEQPAAVHSVSRGACDTPANDPDSVSIAALLGNPERFEGKPVRVIGFYHGSFEHSAIYLSQSDFEHRIASNGFWVAGTVPKELNERYILVEGIFTLKSRGHMGMWSGMICGISRVSPWA